MNLSINESRGVCHVVTFALGTLEGKSGCSVQSLYSGGLKHHDTACSTRLPMNKSRLSGKGNSEQQ